MRECDLEHRGLGSGMREEGTEENAGRIGAAVNKRLDKRLDDAGMVGFLLPFLKCERPAE